MSSARTNYRNSMCLANGIRHNPEELPQIYLSGGPGKIGASDCTICIFVRRVSTSQSGRITANLSSPAPEKVYAKIRLICSMSIDKECFSKEYKPPLGLRFINPIIIILYIT